MNASAAGLAALLLLRSSTALAAAAAPSTPYELGPEAAMQAGCMAPCLCAVQVQSALQGSFALTPDGFDGIYRHYLVDAIDWRFKSGGNLVHVTGSGTYRVAGDQQELVVDLAVDGLPVERYDSGLTAGGSSFPALRLPVALNGFFCHDSVYGVQATPAVAGIVPARTQELGLRLGPNPFHATSEISFSLLAEAPVDLRVHDLAGREVRALATGLFSPGPHAVTWDGRDARGVSVAAGIYFVRLRTPGHESRASIVKLE